MAKIRREIVEAEGRFQTELDRAPDHNLPSCIALQKVTGHKCILQACKVIPVLCLHRIKTGKKSNWTWAKMGLEMFQIIRSTPCLSFGNLTNDKPININSFEVNDSINL
jgi:hypothetical protein